MKRKFNVFLLLSLSLLLSYGAGCQDTGRFAVSGIGGTLGLGGEFTAEVATNVKARVGMHTFDFDMEEEIEDIEFDLGLELNNISALVDWHIFEGPFHVTGGFISMDNEIDLDAKPAESVEIGDIEYTPEEIGTLSGGVDIDGMSPYLGIGWGYPMIHQRRWGFTFDLGVAFTDSPDVALTAADGLLSTDEDFLADLEKERKDIEDELEVISMYPVIYMGFFYRF
jgi:hypothetical protein